MLKANSWIITPKPVPKAKLQLFCFPHAGGGVAFFSQWIKHLPTNVEVHLVLLPGRENRFKESPYTDINLLVHDLSEVISEFLNIPYAFYGHSMGGLISFELTRYLRRCQQLCPSHLFISAHRAPQIPARFAPLHKLSPADFLETLRLLEGTPDQILGNREMMELMYPTLQSDLQMCETYQYSPEPPLQCPISTYGGVDDPRVSSQDLEEWGIQTYSDFQSNILAGGHFFIQDSQKLFLEMLSQELNQLLLTLE
ncbi:MAG: thioesterase [SAR324 cluster bacterium]|nr:thioesterase [SAR324 cluster bacterium]